MGSGVFRSEILTADADKVKSFVTTLLVLSSHFSYSPYSPMLSVPSFILLVQ